MYHELALPGRPLCSMDPGYVRYVVTEAAFRSQMDALVRRSMGGCAVSEWVNGGRGEGRTIVLTFDDGCETDLIAAVPVLREKGFTATFYLTVDFIGRPGYLSPRQARELFTSGMEVGCHSMSHAYLSELDVRGLEREVDDAKVRLEQICGGSIRSFSCPGGRYDARVVAHARAAGFETVVTSDATLNRAARSNNPLGRIAVLNSTDASAFARLLDGRGLRTRQARHALLVAAKRMLGNRLYEQFRARLLPL